MGWDYRPDYAGIAGYLKSDPELRAELRRRAELGLTVARALAPRLREPRPDRIPGALAASGKVTDDGIGGVHHDRMQFSVVFDIFYAAAVTYRFRHNPDQAARAYLMAAIPVIEKG
jgi:hypothetical protein